MINLFDITTLAILFPSCVLWVLMYASYNRKPARLLLTDTARSGWKQQIQVYGSSFVVTELLLILLVSLNFGHFSTITRNQFLDAILMFAVCQFFSIIFTLPLFCLLQRRLTSWPVLIHCLFFSLMAMLILPIFEFFRASIGLLPIPLWFIKDVFRVDAALSTIPSSLLGMAIAFRNTTVIRPVGVSSCEFLEYRAIIQSPELDEQSLQNKSDEEINKIIEVAKSLGDLPKADFLSKTLLDRHNTDAGTA